VKDEGIALLGARLLPSFVAILGPDAVVPRLAKALPQGLADDGLVFDDQKFHGPEASVGGIFPAYILPPAVVIPSQPSAPLQKCNRESGMELWQLGKYGPLRFCNSRCAWRPPAMFLKCG